MSFDNDPQRKRLHELLVGTDFFTADYYDAYGQRLALLLNQEVNVLVGHVLLDVLEESGISPDDIDGIGARLPLGMIMATAVINATASRGQELDAFAYTISEQVDDKPVATVTSSFSANTSSVVLLVSRHSSTEDILKAVDALEDEGIKVKALLALVSHTQHEIEILESMSLRYLYAF